MFVDFNASLRYCASFSMVGYLQAVAVPSAGAFGSHASRACTISIALTESRPYRAKGSSVLISPVEMFNTLDIQWTSQF